ncbi:hypothetical protein ACFVRR_15135 [Gottfriedia sp. NPDC057948]
MPKIRFGNMKMVTQIPTAVWEKWLEALGLTYTIDRGLKKCL